MARKSETGIEYFPMNSDIIHNSKVKLVVAEFGPQVWALLLPLYCKIYREKGYWIDWSDEDSKLLFAQDDCKLKLTVVDEYVNGCLRRSLFDKRVFDTFGVLTSDRIQENYLEAKRRSRSVELINEFIVISESDYKKFDNVYIIDLNVNIIKKNVDISPQKEKEKKKEKLEGEGDDAGAHAHSPDELKLFADFKNWTNKHTPRVNQLKEPLTISEYLSLRKKISKPVLTSVLKSMQNYKELLKKYVSANLTIQKWAKRENESLPPDTVINDTNEKLKILTNGVDKLE